jgi:hypothetical protein
MSETRTRFLREIAARIPEERLAEIHLFPAIRQGPIESGMAVVAAKLEPVVPEPAGADSAGPEPVEPQVEIEPLLADVAPPAAAGDVVAESDFDSLPAEPPAAGATPMRHTVYTARYRATLKGPDRGKWEFSLVAEADAPLVTVDAVVRGVQRRSADVAEPERLTPDTLRAMDDATWPISTS